MKIGPAFSILSGVGTLLSADPELRSRNNPPRPCHAACLLQHVRRINDKDLVGLTCSFFDEMPGFWSVQQNRRRLVSFSRISLECLHMRGNVRRRRKPGVCTCLNWTVGYRAEVNCDAVWVVLCERKGSPRPRRGESGSVHQDRIRRRRSGERARGALLVARSRGISLAPIPRRRL